MMAKELHEFASRGLNENTLQKITEGLLAMSKSIENK